MQTVKACALGKLSKEDVENYHDYQNRVQRCIGQRSTSVCKQTKHANPPLRLIPKPIHTDSNDMPLNTSAQECHNRSTQDCGSKNIHHSKESIKCKATKQDTGKHDQSTRRSSVIESKEMHSKLLSKSPKLLLTTKESLSAFLKILSDHILHCPELEQALRDNFLIS